MNNRIVNFPNWEKVQFSPNQAKVYQDESDFILVKAGRFYGKDHILLFKALVKAFTLYAERINNPEWDRLGVTVQMFVISPTENNANDLWTRIQGMLPKIPGVAINGNDNIHIRNDAREIQIFGSEGIAINFFTTTRADNVRGNGCDILLVTECAYHDKKDLYEVLFNCTIRAGYAGIIYLNSSPKGAGHWFDNEVKQLRNKRGHLYGMGFSLHEGDLYDNPRTSEKEIKHLKATKKTNIYSARREILGWLDVPIVSEFMLGDGEGLAFHPEQIQKITITNPVAEQGPYRVGIDLATTGNDALAVCVLDSQGIVVKLERHKTTPFEKIVEIITRINNTYRPISIVFDSNMGVLRNVKSGDLATMPLIPVNMDNTKKVQFVENFLYHLMAQSIKIPNPDMYYRGMTAPLYMEENLHRLFKEIREYRKFSMINQRHIKGKITDNVKITYGKGTDGTDDLIDALIYAASEFPVPYGVQSAIVTDQPRPSLMNAAPAMPAQDYNDNAAVPAQPISFGGFGGGGRRKSGLFG